MASNTRIQSLNSHSVHFCHWNSVFLLFPSQLRFCKVKCNAQIFPFDCNLKDFESYSTSKNFKATFHSSMFGVTTFFSAITTLNIKPDRSIWIKLQKLRFAWYWCNDRNESHCTGATATNDIIYNNNPQPSTPLFRFQLLHSLHFAASK